jgi:hypothetical protein
LQKNSKKISKNLKVEADQPSGVSSHATLRQSLESQRKSIEEKKEDSDGQSHVPSSQVSTSNQLAKLAKFGNMNKDGSNTIGNLGDAKESSSSDSDGGKMVQRKGKLMPPMSDNKAQPKKRLVKLASKQLAQTVQKPKEKKQARPAGDSGIVDANATAVFAAEVAKKVTIQKQQTTAVRKEATKAAALLKEEHKAKKATGGYVR